MFKLPTLSLSSIKELPIFRKSLTRFSFEGVNDLKEIV